VSTLALAQDQSHILASLRRLGGLATVGDVVADSGLPADDVRRGLKSLLETHRGHLSVADSGELVYTFDPRFIERDSDPFLVRARRTLGKVVRSGFKAWIVIMLVVYFVIFVALAIAALLASQRGSDSRGGWGGGRSHRGGFHFDPLLWYWIWSPRWHIGRPYYGHRWERTLPEGDRVPFYKKVFAFVFGPDRPEPTQKQLDRSKLRLIRARKGVLTTAELVEHSGSTYPDAEQDMGRLLGSYDGEAAASPNGQVVYAFPGLMASARDTRPVREPSPAWLRLEPARELTGNTTGANTLVAGMNAFTLVASATAPWFIFPRLGIGGTAAYVGLVLIPVLFSVLFFAAPLVRMAGVKLENRRRERRNVRRLLLGLVYRHALGDGRAVSEKEAWDFVRERMQGATESAVRSTLREIAAEFDADVEVGDDGVARYTFPAVREQFTASESMRRKLRLDQRSLGEIVFSTGDTAAEADARDLELFDRELLRSEPDLDRYLPMVDRVDYEDDFELVAFDEELRRGRVR
jgi:hypothetical protein